MNVADVLQVWRAASSVLNRSSGQLTKGFFLILTVGYRVKTIRLKIQRDV